MPKFLKSDARKKLLFLSHSSVDQAQAEIILQFLTSIINEIDCFRNQFAIFYAPKNLTKELSTPNWREEIVKNVKQTYCFISYYTPNSILSRWSNFEIGIAYSENIRIVPIASSCIKTDVGRSILDDEIIHTIRPFPRSSQESNSESCSDVIDWLMNVFYENKQAIVDWSSKPENQVKILKFKHELCERIVYIVGSKPNPQRKINKNFEWDANYVADFVERLTSKILNEGYTVASSPRVPNVGESVAKAAYNMHDVDRYNIVGLYKIEQAYPKNHGKDYNYKLNESYENTNKGKDYFWENVIKRHRENYLQDIAVYIVLGGNKNTKDEFRALTRYNHVITLPLHCFGGFSKELYDSTNNKEESHIPCLGCASDYRNCPKMNELVNYIKIYRGFKWGEPM